METNTINEARELYVIRDKVAQDVGPVFEARNEAVAIRSYKQLLEKSPCPQDYELYRIGYVLGLVLIPECHIVVIETPEECMDRQIAMVIDNEKK